jgi:enoyl-[acyl-carrier-protein] reductase (NADH)
MEFNFLKGKKILLILQRDWCMKHGFEVAKKLKESGAELSTLVFKKEIEGFIETQKEVKFSYILKHSEIDENHIKINQESGYKVKMLLDDYKINSIWENAFTLREKSISLNKYPFSFAADCFS